MGLSGFISFLFDIFDIPPHRRITRKCTPHSQPSLKSRSVWAPVFYFIFYISWSLLNGCFRSTTTEYVRTTVESALERSVGGDGIVDQICFFFFLGKAAAVHCVFVDLGWDREGVCICAVVGKLLQVRSSENWCFVARELVYEVVRGIFGAVSISYSKMMEVWDSAVSIFFKWCENGSGLYYGNIFWFISLHCL